MVCGVSETSRKTFGGRWSDDKLQALKEYLSAYGQVLSKRSFDRIYIDAFAGAGTREVVQKSEEFLFDEALAEEEATYRHGSPLIALGIEPAFHRFIFIERDAESIAKLREEVGTHFPEKLRQVDFRQGDANQQLQALTKEDWRRRRAVAFLDPFALHVKWETIEMIAQTKAIDMWLLFPAMAVNRMLPRSGVVPQKWAEKLTETFGSEDWQHSFYEKQQADLFGEESLSKAPKVFEKLSEFITKRLDSVFEGANKQPLILRNSSGAPLFLFCFASGNPKGAPIALRIANHIVSKKSNGY
jgi:three-Cys-motif partner protein